MCFPKMPQQKSSIQIEREAPEEETGADRIKKRGKEFGRNKLRAMNTNSGVNTSGQTPAGVGIPRG